MAPNVLITVTLDAMSPSLADAATRTGLDPADLDAGYGVVPIDPEQKLFSVSVREDRVGAIIKSAIFSGPFSNPPIAPFSAPGNSSED
jgi:hypothetical protein